MLATQPFFSLPEAAKAMGVSESSLRRWVKRSQIACRRLPSGRVEIPREEIERWLTVRPAADQVVAA